MATATTHYYFYECGICDALHPCQSDEDCRKDETRFFADELDERYGSDNWTSVPMNEADDWPAEESN